MSSLPDSPETMVKALTDWGKAIAGHPDRDEAIDRAVAANAWFTPAGVDQAMRAIASGYLEQEALSTWLSKYALPVSKTQTIGLVLAGNIPAVGFHDLLCVLAAGHRAQVKLSQKDAALLPWMVERLAELNPSLAERVIFTERLADFDAVVATGSNNAGRYFDHYFGKHPNLIRRNRQSAAVLDGTETSADWEGLGHDILDYFGLGCRSVSKLYIPEDFDSTHILDALEPFRDDVLAHSRYRHNYDYQRTLLLLNQQAHLASDFVMLVENPALASPISCIHYQRYADEASLQSMLDEEAAQRQVTVGKSPGMTPFGRAQYPGPADYADGVDTLAFLTTLR